jgi:uncharacterized protein (DUF2141 family)
MTWATLSTALSQNRGTLTVEVLNFKNQTGTAALSLFRESDAIPKKPYLKVSAAIVGGKAIFVMEDVAFGEYAAIAFHDENENEILDHKFGMPNESMGFSNGWKLSLFSGMPTFEKLKFHFLNSATVQSIVLKD